jgi:RsmE family RNA methyltransferase
VDILTVNLILLAPTEVPESGDVTVTGQRASHLLNILNVTTGKQVRVGIANGRIGFGTVISIADGTVQLRCEFEEIPPRPSIDLLLALPRPKVMRRLWAQIAALGVGRIILTNAARVERNYFDTHILSPETYGPLMVEGLQQARDTHVPVVSIHRRFKALIEDEIDRLCPDENRLVAHPGAGPSISAAVAARGDGRVLLAIGPEGGWDDFELSLLARHRFMPVSIGPRSLRSDTACVALLAMASEALRPGRQSPG